MTPYPTPPSQPVVTLGVMMIPAMGADEMRKWLLWVCAGEAGQLPQGDVPPMTMHVAFAALWAYRPTFCGLPHQAVTTQLGKRLPTPKQGSAYSRPGSTHLNQGNAHPKPSQCRV